MEYMLVFTEPARGTSPAVASAAMEKAARELEANGTLSSRGSLKSNVGTRIRVRDGKADLSEGPIVEGGEIVSGFWIVDVASRDAAVEIAKRCPHAKDGVIEVQAVMRRDFPPADIAEKPFLFLFRIEPGLTDPFGEKFTEMRVFHEQLRRDGKLVNSAPLDFQKPAARIRSKGGKIVVTDGPFAETKEGVGGYSLIGAASYAAAVELGTRIPHARWGPIEVRELT